MDLIKEKMNFDCPVGGIHCKCCNRYRGKERKILRRRARRFVKSELNKEMALIED